MAWAEKFLNIKSRIEGIRPDAVVIVATVRALKMHGGVNKEELGKENLETLAKGMENLAQQVNNIRGVYELDKPIEEKISAIATKIYHADGVIFTDNALRQIKKLKKLGYDNVPVCMAKTQYSFSDDPALLGAPKNFFITVRNVKISVLEIILGSFFM